MNTIVVAIENWGLNVIAIAIKLFAKLNKCKILIEEVSI